MLKAKVFVDLPSQDLMRRKGPIEWVRSLFGADLDLRTGKEELTVSAFALVQGLVDAFGSTKLAASQKYSGFGKSGGIVNAISLLVDKRTVYLDADDVDDDLDEMAEAAQTAGVFDRPFKEMHLVMTHKVVGLHVIFDVAIQNSVLVGEDEMEIILSARVEDLQIRQGESAKDYGTRVKAFTKDPDAIEGYRLALDGVARALADRMRVSLVGSKVRVEGARIEIIRPNQTQVGRMRTLGFKDKVKQPTYRPAPTRRRRGAYADPFFYYYYDPYYDFMSLMLVSAIVHDMAWHSPMVHVVSPNGDALFTGDTVDSTTASMDGWDPDDAVGFDETGDLQVDDSMPQADVDGDPVEAGMDADGSNLDDGGGWDGDGGWDDSGGDTSSCGTSCSSSCGSSCASCSSCGGCGGCG